MSESLKDLIQQAREMLRDRQKAERDLIYHIAKLSNGERVAIIFAYDLLRDDEIEKDDDLYDK